MVSRPGRAPSSRLLATLLIDWTWSRRWNSDAILIHADSGTPTGRGIRTGQKSRPHSRHRQAHEHESLFMLPNVEIARARHG